MICIDHQCEQGTCQPFCEGKQCGSDGCEGICGDCPPDQLCDEGLCVTPCLPFCDGKECGPDGCGGVCGQCLEGNHCDQGICVSSMSCQGFCGTVTPGGCSCQTGCQLEGTCCEDACDVCQGQDVCPCTISCFDRECGPDGCGGICGNCASGFACEDEPGECIPEMTSQTCEELLYCMDICADDDCSGLCYQMATVTAQDDFTALYGCISETCADCEPGSLCFYKCLFEDCLAFVDPCMESAGGTCDEIFTCTLACEGDNSCVEDCLVIGDSQAKLLYIETLACLDEECTDQPASCYQSAIHDACYSQYQACKEHCIPRCDDKKCGGDGCGGQCGTCLPDQTCVQGICQVICVPDCAGKTCGDDGCGASCGTCEEDFSCIAGACEDDNPCKPKHTLQCKDGDLYWFDSCQQPQELAMECADSCEESKCVTWSQDITSQIEDVPEGDPIVAEPITFSANGSSSSSCSMGTDASATNTAGLGLLLMALLALALRGLAFATRR
jgi:hypothetical protein